MLWLWILLGVAALLVVLAAVGYNRLVRLRNEADTGWANIDVQLQRRGDLIPNLVEAVRGYAAHERGVFEEVTKARAALQQAGTPGAAGEANDILSAALGRLFAVAEAYPELQGIRELPPPPGGPDGHGGQDQRRAPLLQLDGHALQHRDPEHPVGARRSTARLRGEGVLLGGG